MLDSFTEKQKKMVVVATIILSIVIIYFIYKRTNDREKVDLNESILIQNITENNTNENKISKDTIVIHIAGAVRKPGVVKLEEGARIEDAVDMAGGLTEDADITNVNLAYVVEDGTKINIPRTSLELDGIDEEFDIIQADSGKNVMEDMQDAKDYDTQVNINKATESELENLPGIGSSLATKIIEYRNENGKFNSVEDIKNVNGIGESKYDNIRKFICVK